VKDLSAPATRAVKAERSFTAVQDDRGRFPFFSNHQLVKITLAAFVAAR